MPYPRNLAELIDVTVACEPDRLALVDRTGSWSYRELDHRANQVANALVDAGVEAGDRIAVLIGNENRYVEALLGAWRAGATAVIPNTRLTSEQIAAQVVHSEAMTVVADVDNAGAAERAESELRTASSSRRALVLVEAAYDQWREAALGTRPVRTVDPSGIALQPYTSGSTGEPKGVLLSHRGQLQNARAVAKVDLIDETDRALVSAPIFHANAMAGAVLPFLLVGGSVVILPRFETGAVAAAVERFRCTFMTGVPTMYAAMLSEKIFERHDLGSLRFVGCGSAPVTAELLHRLEAALPGVPVLEGYGLTEAGPVVTKSPRFGLRRLGSIGLPLEGVDVRLLDHALRPVRAGDVGEIVVRSPGLALGFHKNADAFAARLVDGEWYRTGDLAHADPDGYLYFRGRVDDMLNVGGENVHPQTVEALIRSYPGVVDVVVVGAPHELKGQVPVAYVVAQAGIELDPADVKEFCLRHGPAFAHPREVHLLERLPVGSTGKVDRRLLDRGDASTSVSSGDEGADRAG